MPEAQEPMREAAIAEPEAPAGWIVRFAPLVPRGRPVLDVACGAGRHARLFLERGHPVTAVDADTGPIGALKRYPGLEVVRADLEGGGPWPFPGRAFAGIVVTNYLWRPLFPHLIGALAPGGVLLYETFAVGHAAYGKPARPEFLLRPGELLDLARGRLQVVAYEHGYVAAPRPSVRQRICAVNGAEPLALNPSPQAGGAGASRPPAPAAPPACPVKHRAGPPGSTNLRPGPTIRGGPSSP